MQLSKRFKSLKYFIVRLVSKYFNPIGQNFYKKYVQIELYTLLLKILSSHILNFSLLKTYFYNIIKLIFLKIRQYQFMPGFPVLSTMYKFKTMPCFMFTMSNSKNYFLFLFIQLTYSVHLQLPQTVNYFLTRKKKILLTIYFFFTVFTFRLSLI